MVNDLNPDRADTVAEEITTAGGRALAWQADVTNRFQVSSMIERARDEFGRVDILINAAGVYKAGGLDKLDEWEWERILNVNMTGAFYLTQLLSRVMIAEGGGVIVNIAATAGHPGDDSTGRSLCRQQVRLDRLDEADRPRTRAAWHPRECRLSRQPRRRRSTEG